ncbi:cytochrome P450 [Mycolicibacterium septicum]|uniref:Cytochrome P450 n=1 Tax=Mycolicibacterium septicum TaxID=98668 RepID=A0ABW9LRV3_9MYCO
MTVDIDYDPYNVEITRDPYPTYRRLRDEAPLYYNATHDFFAVSRYDDVERALIDRDTFISGRGNVLEFIKSGVEMPPGIVVAEDPPSHTIHRTLMSRVFTPRKVAALEPAIRTYCAEYLDPLIGTGRFDVIGEFAAQMPMRVISMLMGIPDADQIAIRDMSNANMRTKAGRGMRISEQNMALGGAFADYIDWRVEHPSDDIMTDLLNVEFEDQTGTRRRLTRRELLTYVHVIAGAGNETSARLIGWTVKVLAEHPEQRRELVRDRSLVPNAIEEILRFENPAPHAARSLAVDAQWHGRTVPAGSALLIVMAAANRDERRYAEPDRFDIHRDIGMHLAFGHGAHFCLGAALARIEARIALDEILTRFPDWDVDLGDAALSPTSTVRGWERLPMLVA